MRNTRIPIYLLAVILAITAPAALFAQVGKPSGGGDTITFDVQVTGHSAIELRVTGADVEFTKSFTAGKPVTVSLRDFPGNGRNVEDGTYHYEVTVVPRIPSAVATKLAAARAAGDEKAANGILKAAGIAVDVRQSGAFQVSNGTIVPLGLTENDANDARSPSNDASGSPSAGSNLSGPAGRFTPQVQDQVIPDDLIVQSSLCVGFDCVDGESFGFDTIRLKENNTRIKFEDTSTGSFPTNDWQLTANDSASGGASKFSIEDITGAKVPFTVTAGAATNSIFVDSTGRIGARTGTPVLDLHISTSNTPAIRFEQTNAGGFTAQTWDIGANEANFFVRDVTGGSRLPFRIRPGAPTSSIDVAADGEVGIATASPDADLHVFSSATADSNIGLGQTPSSGGSGGLNITYSGGSTGRGASIFNARPDASAVAPNPSLRFWTNDVQRLIIDNEGFVGLGTVTNPDAPIHWTNGVNTARLTTAGVWQDSSSRVAKENINELDSAQAFKTLENLKPVTYNYKVLPTDPKVGFIAEDVPELVATPERDGLSALDIVAVLTKVVQEQQKTIDELSKRVDELQKEN